MFLGLCLPVRPLCFRRATFRRNAAGCASYPARRGMTCGASQLAEKCRRSKYNSQRCAVKSRFVFLKAFAISGLKVAGAARGWGWPAGSGVPVATGRTV
jgi:hypothetical protein